MYLQKIEIPSFRVLHDVALEFGEIYSPQIFPLGSENGGGKSTVLQLLFALLHCSTDPKRLPYLQNLLATDSIPSTEAQRVIARLTLRIEDESHTLEFISLGDLFLQQNLLDESPRFGFETEARNIYAAKEELQLKTELQGLTLQADEVAATLADKRPLTILQRAGRRSYIEFCLQKARKEAAQTTTDWTRITNLMAAHNQRFLTTYGCMTRAKEVNMRALVCRIPGQELQRTQELLQAAASQVFLLGPSSQQYLFLPRDIRKAPLENKVRPVHGTYSNPREALLPKPSPQLQYLQTVEEAETVLTGFLAYDWLCVEPLVKLFEKSRNHDFKQVVQTGAYGTRYTTLLQELNRLLFGKRVRPLMDDSDQVIGVEFIVPDESGLETPLSLEDLSQGELKRLMIYAWLRSSNIQDALVLIDEIETSFHPDWQSRIVKDLHEWGPSNQYILATHSYELCQALTPRHVRELTPRLRRADQPPEV